MGFLTPWFLAGITALGLPIWLHLLKRHRSTPTPFPSIRFFERRTQSSVKYRRLAYILLFCLRTALVLLLVLAFANPFIRTKHTGAGGKKRVVVAIDNSFSMRQGGRLEQAKREAQALPHAQVLAFNSRVEQADTVQAVGPSDGASSYAELVRALRTMGTGMEVHLFSDMQKTSMPANFADVRLPEGVTLVPHAVGPARVGNLAVENASVAGKRVSVTVVSHGAAAGTRRVSVLLNGKETASKSLAVPADGRATVEFADIEAPYGAARGEVRIDSGDGFPDDDRFYFSMSRREPRPALFVRDMRDTRAALYVETALNASGEPEVKLEVVTPEQTANLAPAKYVFVVLSDVAALPAAFESALTEYVREGGALLMALGPAAAVRGRIPVLGQAAVAERFAQAETWQGVRFYHAVRVEPGEARVTARLSDSTPLLLEQRLGAGRVMLFASTFDNVSNDFPLHASFVPFIQQTARELVGEGRQARSVNVGSFLELPAGGQVLDPAGRRPLSLDASTRAQALRLESAGFYDVRRPNGRDDLVAVNPDRRESDLEALPGETLALWRDTGRGTTVEAGGEVEERRNPLGWYVLVAALVLALAESILGNRHLAADREPLRAGPAAAGSGEGT